MRTPAPPARWHTLRGHPCGETAGPSGSRNVRDQPPVSSECAGTRFSHICVDEFHDVDAAQLRLIRLLAAPEDNLFVVGDDDQP